MSDLNNDSLITKAIQTSVDGTSTYVSNPIPLAAGQAISIQVQCSGGASGTVNVDGCNQAIPTSSNQLPPNSPINWLLFESQDLSADQNAVLSYSLADQITTMANMRIRFVSKSAGAVVAAVNVRRFPD